MSWGNHADLAPQAVLRDISQIIPVNSDTAFVRIVKAHQQSRERGFASSGCADEPDMFVRPDVEIDIRKRALSLLVLERNIFESDLTGNLGQLDGSRVVHHAVRHGQGPHPVFGFADVGIDRHQDETHPAGHLRDPDRDASRRRDVSRCCCALSPKNQRSADKNYRQQTGQSHERKPESRRDLAEFQCPESEPFQGIQRRAVFISAVREQFYRANVRYGIDDLPRKH